MKRCLIVVDYQNDFVTGALGFAGAEALDGRLAQRVRAYHERGDAVLFTKDIHFTDYLSTHEGRRLPVEHCIRGGDGLSFFGRTGRERTEDDLVFEKSAFGSDALYEHLKRTPYAHIELAGVLTNVCVLVNAVLARTAQPETDISIDERLVATGDETLGRQALNVLRSLHIDIFEKGGAARDGEKSVHADGLL